MTELDPVETPVEPPASVQVSEPVTQAPKVEGEAQGTGDVVPKEGGSPDEGAAPAYKAREKFKVLDQEHEVPAWLKTTMKDAASERQAMELLEKAYGLDPVKADRAQVRQQRDEARRSFSEISDQITDARDTYQKGDIDLWLSKLGVPAERMLQWALDKVQYSQLPPEHQRLYDERTNAQRQTWQLEKQNQMQAQQFNEQVSSAKRTMLDSGLARPDVQSISETFDARMGKSGAFRAEVVATGELAWAQSGGKVDLTPEQAISQVLTKWRPFLGPSTAPQANAQPMSGGGLIAPSSPAQATVIPNVQGRGSSPMKAKARSLDDLRKLRDQSN